MAGPGSGSWWRSSRASLAVFFLRPRAIPVRTAVAVEAAASSGAASVLNASGYVTARRQATVSSKITGKVAEVLVEEGMKVEAGQVLARLDDRQARLELELAQAQLAAAEKGARRDRGQPHPGAEGPRAQPRSSPPAASPRRRRSTPRRRRPKASRRACAGSRATSRWRAGARRSSASCSTTR